MPVTADNIKIYGSEHMREGDADSQGGAIDTSKKVIFSDISTASILEAWSSVNDDGKTVTVTGRDESGVIRTAVATLPNAVGTATTATNVGTQVFERILKIVLSAASTGTITVQLDGNAGGLATLEPGITEVRRPFYGAVAAASTTTKKYYEKVFVKNEHASLALTNAKIYEQSDGTGKIAFGLENNKGGNGTSSDRLHSPAIHPTDPNKVKAFQGTTGESGAQDVAPGSSTDNHLGNNETQGVWLELTLPPGTPPDKDTYTLRVTGETV